MKVLIKKFTVIAAAFAMLFAISACKDPTGSTDSNNNAAETSTTTDSGQGTSGQGSGGQGSGGQATQTVTTVAVYESMDVGLAYLSFYSDNTWKVFVNFEGVFEAYESGTYTGNPAQDGAVKVKVTKMVPDDSETGELEDCTPEDMNLTITDGIFEIVDKGQSLYLIRKSDVVATYGCLMPSDDDVVLVTYRFYEDNTWRIFLNGSLSSLGVYEGDPSVDGQVSMEMKYTYSEDDGLEEDSNEYTFGIEYDCFTGVQDEIVARELEVFKYSETDENWGVVDNFIKFYADSDEDEDTDGTFLRTYTIMGIEIPFEYGTYTGNPSSTEANTSISLNTTCFYTYNPATDEEGTWGEALESTYDIVTLNNNQLIDETYIFIRQ